MITEAWTFLLHVVGLLLHSLTPCTPPEILSMGNIDTKQYLGSWYFIAVAGERDSDVNKFRAVDSTIIVLQEAANANTLLFNGSIRVGNRCIKEVWPYHIRPGRDDLERDGIPERLSPLWSGRLLNCSECIFLQESEQQPPLNRVLFYARSASVSTEMIKEFQMKVSCLGMRNVFVLPQEKEYCQLDEMA
ncbi:apolipoprotein M isoform X2 [Paramormyrops kingsleyae]|uniref:Apolipoprotein M n=1 Tax=Paramormyrops kingsleyae TaxID=1676925 RepID=A0A3B3SPX1_9TELE|nr:apolipoprotein M-like [Paramormyrops kingsleyae]